LEEIIDVSIGGITGGITTVSRGGIGGKLFIIVCFLQAQKEVQERLTKNSNLYMDVLT
jgi:hypothetical protein